MKGVEILDGLTSKERLALRKKLECGPTDLLFHAPLMRGLFLVIHVPMDQEKAERKLTRAYVVFRKGDLLDSQTLPLPEDFQVRVAETDLERLLLSAEIRTWKSMWTNTLEVFGLDRSEIETIWNEVGAG